MKLIADEKIIFESPDPAEIYCYTPGLCVGFPGKNGRNRLVAACDFGGPGIQKMEGPSSSEGDYAGNQIRVRYSDDGGDTWQDSPARLPFRHEILFKAGKSLYMIGNDKRLVISRSTDNGETWSDPSVLDDAHKWHQSCGSVDVFNGKIYLVYEQYQPDHNWPGVMPVFMAAEETADLTKREAWRFSEPWDPDPELAKGTDLCLIQRWDTVSTGILETNVQRIRDPKHPFATPDETSWMLLMRLESGLLDLGAVLMGHEAKNGTLTIRKARYSDLSEVFFLPIPGGSLKFHIQYDEVGKLYWLIASQIDGIHCARRRLGLYYSPDCFAWTFAGMVAAGPSENGSRHYATLAIDGDDLFVLSRSGDERAKSAHDNNFQTFHCVRNFRKLAES